MYKFQGLLVLTGWNLSLESKAKGGYELKSEATQKGRGHGNATKGFPVCLKATNCFLQDPVQFSFSFSFAVGVPVLLVL